MSEDYINYNYKMPVNKGKINMKNIHVLPTDKPSRLFYSDSSKKLMLSSTAVSFKTFERSPQNIYITNDEEIKEGDYIFETDNGYINIAGRNYIKNETDFKIIISTDEYLIKDGVQEIDDEFLEWFVKNPSCEYIEVESGLFFYAEGEDRRYKIFIPQEEPKQELEKELFDLEQELGIPSSMRWHNSKPKQETLEEAAKRFYTTEDTRRDCNFIEGAKWQAERMGLMEMGLMEIELRHTKTLLASCEKALEDRDKQAERMYSEEEVYDILIKHTEDLLAGKRILLNEWFEQFKKK